MSEPPQPPKKRSVEVMTTEHETLLWKLGILNLTESIGLSRAAFFYFCKAFGVYSRSAIRDVIREQFQFGSDDLGKYVEFVDFAKQDAFTPGGSAIPSRRVIQYDDPNNDYSVFKIMATYMLHIPASGVFFRRPLSPTLECPKPIQFCHRAIGINHLSHYLSDMMKSAGLWKGHFTTQSIKSAVVSLLFRIGIDEESFRQRTRWWSLGRVTGSDNSSARQDASGMRNLGSRSKPDRQKVLTISKLLDPPPFTLLCSPRPQQTGSPSVVDIQVVNTLERDSSSDGVTPHAPSTSHSEMSSPPVQTSSHPPYRDTQSTHQEKEQGSHSETYRWFQGPESYGAAAAECGLEVEQVGLFLPKRSRFASPKSPDGQSDTQQEFVAMSGPVLDSAVPKQVSRSPYIKTEPDEEEDDDCCVVASSIDDQSQISYDHHTKRATSTKPSTTCSISSSRQDTRFHDKSRAGLRNQMQCLTNNEMKEVSSRPPRDETSALSLAFKFAYEIDHNGEVAANREIRALHTTASNDSPSSLKRRLLPLNVVDSSGKEATEKQEEFPNFSIKLSDFFPSISQRSLDIRDVVIRGTRGQGTDRLNVEVVVAEKRDCEQDVQLVEQFDF